MKRLILRQGHDRRIRNGHPWIFSNEIDRVVGNPEPGDALEVVSHRQESYGTAYYNPHSLITARLLSRERISIDEAGFFKTRIAAAADYRQALYGDLQALRIVHGEGDGLPGLVVDRYGDLLSVQFLTLGIDRRRDLITEALIELFQPTAIVARNDVGVRELEGLPQQTEILSGSPPETTTITEHGLRYRINVLHGQKTGHFLDQKENHLTLQNRVENRRVLDLFCYSGGWATHAARFGAKEVLGVDISAEAIALATENARLNYQETICRFEKADAFEKLRELHHTGERFGLITLDPPAFVKSKKKLAEAIRGYLTINRRAMELVEPGGYLITCSCSYHLQRDQFLETLRQAASQAGRAVRLLEMRGQAYDHPVLLSCPETDYLKCAVLQVV
jgi:23S rRNA (cytosine1962-C5)-methyltransferase